MEKVYKYYLVKTDEKVKGGFDLELTQDEVETLKTFVQSSLLYGDYYPEVQEQYEQLQLKLDFISKVVIM